MLPQSRQPVLLPGATADNPIPPGRHETTDRPERNPARLGHDHFSVRPDGNPDMSGAWVGSQPVARVPIQDDQFFFWHASILRRKGANGLTDDIPGSAFESGSLFAVVSLLQDVTLDFAHLHHCLGNAAGLFAIRIAHQFFQ
jgi:hypothetical protein